MSIELIICLVAWIILTEIIFFKYAKDDCDSFIEAKFMSMLLSLMLVGISFGFPAIAATGCGDIDQAVGYIAYVWYYGIILAISLFIGINYLIYKLLEKKNG